MVWIIGHSFVYWAQQRANRRYYASNLGLDPSAFQVFWFGRRGMGWEDLLFEFDTLLMSFPEPSILILHLGGNDIGQMKT